MILSIELRKITDQLSYNLLYAPDYPAEDYTNLEKEAEQIRLWLNKVIKFTQRENVGYWLRLADSTIILAFSKFREKENQAGRKEIETAIQYLKNALSKRQLKAGFLSYPEGMRPETGSDHTI